MGWFVHHYGWRAYALPVLAALTVMAVIGVVHSSGPGDGPAGHDVASGLVTVTVGSSVLTTVTLSGTEVTKTVLRPGAAQGDDGQTSAATGDEASGTRDPGTVSVEAARTHASVPTTPASAPSSAFRGVIMGALPPGQPFAKTGAGTFHVVPGTSKAFGTGSKHRTFTIEVEDGIESVKADKAFAGAVMAILSSPTSWIHGGKFTLQRIDSGKPDFRITLTSEKTTRKAGFCGWNIQLEASCYNHIPGRVIINDARWIRGAYSYDGDLSSYRVYAINHEVGHALGHHHEACQTNGALAPVMMQQSWSTSDDDIAKLNPDGPIPADGKVCRANPFPFPPSS